jgi:hypothetical protein
MNATLFMIVFCSLHKFERLTLKKDGQKISQLRLQASYFAGELHHGFFF